MLFNPYFWSLTIVINAVMAGWIHDDARNKGASDPALWGILVFFTGIFGVILYLLKRPFK
jgi:hypothetical protein